jgi:hypothetical protein
MKPKFKPTRPIAGRGEEMRLQKKLSAAIPETLVNANAPTSGLTLCPENPLLLSAAEIGSPKRKRQQKVHDALREILTANATTFKLPNTGITIDPNNQRFIPAVAIGPSKRKRRGTKRTRSRNRACVQSAIKTKPSKRGG